METISNGQTPLKASDFIARVQALDTSYLKAGTDFYTAFRIALPAYASTFKGEFYKKPRGASDPTALPAAISTNTNGKIYELDMPADAIDLGIQTVVFENASTVLAETSVTNQEDETKWDITSTTTAYWRHAGRKIKCYVPNAYTSSTPKYSTPYKRFPSIPTSSSDAIDCPAEDVTTLFNSWRNNIQKV